MTAAVIDGVGVRFGGRQALRDIDFSIDEGETVAIVGPSGSGKSTLLGVICGAVPPTTGSVTLLGEPLDRLAPGRDLSRLVGIINQQFDLVPQLPVIQNVLAGRLGEWSLARSLISLVVPQQAGLADSALARVGLADRRDARTAKLSGGEQQRVALARLLVQNPRIVLADEPVASLDPVRADDLLALLAAIAAEGRTLVASMHSVPLARRFFRRIIGLRLGVVQFDRPADEVGDDDLALLYALEGLPA